MADYNKLKVTELRELLKDRAIPSTGLTRKQQIIDALEAADADQGENTNDGTAEGETEVTPNADDTNMEGVGARERDAIADDANVEDAAMEDAAQPSDNDVAVNEAEAVAEDRGSSDPQVVGMMAANEESMPDIHQPASTEPSQPATPHQALLPSETSSETRKRKRRSPTPPMPEDTINKKLKSAEEKAEVILPEDVTVKDVPIADGAVAGDNAPHATAIPNIDGSKDFNIERDNQAFSGSVTTIKSAQPAALDRQDNSATSALHPATHTLYIRDFVRPLQPNQLRDHLVSIATTPGSKIDESIVEIYHLDTLRTHAFATFSSVSAALRARAALHEHVWPEEPTRKPLWVDFIPDEKVQDFIDTEVASSSTRRDAKRWEISYGKDVDGHVTATMQEAMAIPTGPAVRQPSSSDTPQPGVGMPNAPLGPRGARAPATVTPVTGGFPNRPPPAVQATEPPPPSAAPKSPTPETSEAPPKPEGESFGVLDERFLSTNAKPKLFYLPKSKELAGKRLDELDAQTSRDWDGGHRGEIQLRRYTFEDGDRVVDNGPDIPNFSGPRRGRGGYRGGYRGYR